MDFDERDDPSLPQSGYHVKATQEVAGFGGDTIFGKDEISLQETYKKHGESRIHSYLNSTPPLPPPPLPIIAVIVFVLCNLIAGRK